MSEKRKIMRRVSYKDPDPFDIEISNIEYVMYNGKPMQIAIRYNGKVLSVPYNLRTKYIIGKIVHAHKRNRIEEEKKYKLNLIRLAIDHNQKADAKLFKNSFIKGNKAYL